MRRRRSGVALGALVLLVACGGDADGPSAVEVERAVQAGGYIDAVAARLREGRAGPVMDDEMADCVAIALAEGAGIDRMIDADISPDEFAGAPDLVSLDVDLPSDLADTLAGRLGECRIEVWFLPALILGTSADFDLDLSTEDVHCVVAEADDDDVADAVAAILIDSSDDPFSGALAETVAFCAD